MSNKQSQKAGNGSIQTQIDNLEIRNGMSYAEVKDLYTLLYEQNFPKLIEEARSAAAERSEEFFVSFMDRLDKDNFEKFENFKSPRKQNDLHTAQKAFAISNGNEELKDTLAALLQGALKVEDDSSIEAILFSDAIEVAAKLSKDQLKLLSLIYFFIELNINVPSIDALVKFTDEHLVKIGIDNIEFSHVLLLALESYGVTRVNTLASNEFVPLMGKKYPGFFCKGLEKELIEREFGQNFEKIPNLIMPCINDRTKFQIAAITEDQLIARQLPFETHSIALRLLRQSARMSEEEMTALIKGKSAALDKFIDNWDDSYLTSSQLSPMGKIIAHTHLTDLMNLPPYELR